MRPTPRTLLALPLLLLANIGTAESLWTTREAAEWVDSEFSRLEDIRRNASTGGRIDRRSSAPFISGDGFRDISQHICEDANRCRMDPAKVKDGDCIFVKSDMFDFFANTVAKQITSTYTVISHNGDLSTPDGQDDAPRIGMPKYIGSVSLYEEFRRGKLIGHFGQNLWWQNHTFQSRPSYSHCIPIGLENRQYRFGALVSTYVRYIKQHVLSRKSEMSMSEKNDRPLLLIAFYPKSRVPDRQKVLTIIGAIPPRGQPKPPKNSTWYNETDLSHNEWLDAIPSHKFVLAPFGHGLDTHRITEILLMGGIPVTRRSTISSCYDDSDNSVASPGGKKSASRGSLPIVILERWEDLTKERLEREWRERFMDKPNSHWDWKRLFINSHLDRMNCPAK